MTWSLYALVLVARLFPFLCVNTRNALILSIGLLT